MTDAQRCRRNGWGPGTKLISWMYGDCCGTVIEITAVGDIEILARCVSNPFSGEEGMWSLRHRKWRKVRDRSKA